MKKLMLLLCLVVVFTGCKPFSPGIKEDINNQNGKIDELRNNQNGVMTDILKLQQKADVNARDIENMQQGLINKNDSHENTGIQILSGDGALLLVFVITCVSLYFIFHYRGRAITNEKVASILATQVAGRNDVELENDIFLASLNAGVQENLYTMMVKAKQDQGSGD